jgi:hypothetical protein
MGGDLTRLPGAQEDTNLLSMRGHRTIILAAVVIAAVLGPASAAWAHGDGDNHRIALGQAGPFEVAVWADGADGTSRVPVLVGVTGATDIARVAVESVNAAGATVVSVATPSATPDFWSATISADLNVETPVVVRVTDETGRERALAFGYTLPASSLLKKLIVMVALAHGAACATWLWGRRHRALRRRTVEQPAVARA